MENFICVDISAWSLVSKVCCNFIINGLILSINNLLVFFFGSYIKIVRREGLEISQPALDPN